MRKNYGLKNAFRRLSLYGYGLFLLCTTAVPGTCASTVPAVTVGATTVAPVIDGDLRDRTWSNASCCNSFYLYTGEKLASEQTKVYVAYDSGNLYVSFVCYDSRIGELRTGESVFAGDAVELFVDPEQTYNYTHIAVNPDGKTYLAWQQGRRENSVTAAVKIFTDRWQAEIAVPWKDIKWSKAGMISNWGMNFCRSIPRTKELTCWSPTLAGFHNPSRFGLVTGMKVDAGQFYIAQQRTQDASTGTLALSTDKTFYGAEKELEAYIRLRFNGSLAGKKMLLSVVDNMGRKLVESAIAPVYLTNRSKINISALAPDDYKIIVSLVEDGRTISECAAWFRKIPPMVKPANRVDIRKGILYLNDKPYLPIILYFGSSDWRKAGEMSVRDIDDAVSKGFNTLLPSWEFLKEDLVGDREKIWKPANDGSVGRIKASSMTLMGILDAARDRNLQVIPYFGFMWRTENLNDESRIKMGADIIQKYRNHPAILCWHANDETDGWSELNKKVYKLYKELDPYRPVHLNLISAVAANNEAADILSTDPYPIGKTSVLQVAVHADTLRHVTGRNAGQSCWLALQMFGSPGEGWPRCPTPGEARCMTFLALNHGARGLAYFGYAPESVRKELGDKRLSEELWQYMAELNRQTATVSAVYLLGMNVEGITSDVKELDIAAKRYGGQTYIIVCNTSEKEVSAKISVAGIKLPQKVQVLFEDRTAAATETSVTDSFTGYDVHIYKL